MISRFALLEPATDGVKTTLTVQVEPATSVLLQVEVVAKLDAFVPVSEITNPVRGATPVFRIVTVWAADARPSSCKGNVIALVERLTAEPPAAEGVARLLRTRMICDVDTGLVHESAG